ncbi:MAG: hypothetical protein M3Q91_17550, partial [Acidobacteriota bacterium]|nr:hypothetical protein [Acidobacteriota bacterium]
PTHTTMRNLSPWRGCAEIDCGVILSQLTARCVREAAMNGAVIPSVERGIWVVAFVSPAPPTQIPR